MDALCVHLPALIQRPRRVPYSLTILLTGGMLGFAASAPLLIHHPVLGIILMLCMIGLFFAILLMSVMTRILPGGKLWSHIMRVQMPSLRIHTDMLTVTDHTDTWVVPLDSIQQVSYRLQALVIMQHGVEREIARGLEPAEATWLQGLLEQHIQRVRAARIRAGQNPDVKAIVPPALHDLRNSQV